VPIFRSRTRMSDAIIDLAMIPAARARVMRRRRRLAPLSSARDTPAAAATGRVAPVEGRAPSGR
jgi:hypothetical protein